MRLTGTSTDQIEALRLRLSYPDRFPERDSQDQNWWYLRSGQDEQEAEETCPIAVRFYPELGQIGPDEVWPFVQAHQDGICGHYLGRVAPDQPVLYLLWPETEAGWVVMVLPSEGRQLRRRQVQTFRTGSLDLEARLNRLSQEALARTQRIQEDMLSYTPLVEWAFYKPIETARELAQQLAAVAKRMEEAIPGVYAQEDEGGYLHRLLASFKRELLPGLEIVGKTEKDYSFADIYAQTIAYGLFTARVFSYALGQEEQPFTRGTAWELLPETNPFLRQLFRDVSQQPIEALGEELGDGISEVFSLLRAAKMDAILEDFRAKMNQEDIVIRFYEDFLAAYKSEMRERRGVYYTPEPVVSYMVRSVDILLKEKFNKPLGLADPEVMILDPACGTGTFLLWIFKLIYGRFLELPELFTARDWNEYVGRDLLPRVFGFELLMAPYAICHLKLGLFLEETGYRFSSGQRLGVYLINTLDDIKLQEEEAQFKLNLPQMEEMIAVEALEGTKVKKREPVTVVIGNPPYSGHSANKSPWIDELLKDYFQVDGKPLGERNPKWLRDDYVKFTRFGQWRIDQSKQGILALITNHGYLDNPTFRGMRRSLALSFDQMYLLDLHGNTKKKEVAPDGSKDENVFDIQQGVSVCFLLKNQKVGA
jgi:hypothetical protein